MIKYRKVLYLITILFLTVAVTAKSQSLPLNAAGKCELAEIVTAEGFSRPTLYVNELKWLKGLTKVDGKFTSVTRDSLAGKIIGEFEFPVYAQSGILKKLNGVITYRFAIEVKEAKYRYSFTDFVYHYYAQDRNYKVVPTGKTKAIEEAKAKGWQKLWNDHRSTVYGRITRQVEELKAKMVETPKDTNAKTEEKKVDW